MAEKKSDTQVVFMVGNSYDAQDGDRRTVSKEQAAELVTLGHARYPANYSGE